MNITIIANTKQKCKKKILINSTDLLFYPSLSILHSQGASDLFLSHFVKFYRVNDTFYTVFNPLIFFS